jgi:hypothetical protein
MTTEIQTRQSTVHEKPEPQDQTTYPRKPLQLKGVLNEFESFDVTPVLGLEFKNVNLAEWLRAPNSDELIRDLAITGIFFHQQLLSLDHTDTHFSVAAWSGILPCAR